MNTTLTQTNTIDTEKCNGWTNFATWNFYSHLDQSDTIWTMRENVETLPELKKLFTYVKSCYPESFTGRGQRKHINFDQVLKSLLSEREPKANPNNSEFITYLAKSTILHELDNLELPLKNGKMSYYTVITERGFSIKFNTNSYSKFSIWKGTTCYEDNLVSLAQAKTVLAEYFESSTVTPCLS